MMNADSQQKGMFSLHGKTVVVTGGGRGIGKGISLAAAKAGANVVLTGRSEGPLNDTANERSVAHCCGRH